MPKKRVEKVSVVPRGLRSTPLLIGEQALVVMSYPLPAREAHPVRVDPRRRRAATDVDPLRDLAPAEREVVRTVLSGFSSDEIAALRGRSVFTINKQIESAYRKLGVSSRGELGARFGHVQKPGQTRTGDR